MEKEFTPYQEALELKELGFDEPCFGYYEDNNLTITFPPTSSNGWKWVGNSIIPAKNTNAPLYQQAFRWFREKHRLSGLIEIGRHEYSFVIFDEAKDSREITSSMNGAYEEAELECVKKLIEIVKNKGGDQ